MLRHSAFRNFASPYKGGPDPLYPLAPDPHLTDTRLSVYHQVFLREIISSWFNNCVYIHQPSSATWGGGCTYTGEYLHNLKRDTSDTSGVTLGIHTRYSESSEE